MISVRPSLSNRLALLLLALSLAPSSQAALAPARATPLSVVDAQAAYPEGPL
jgi:hypothetical protein